MKFIFLFEHTGYAAEPFTRCGHTTYIIDTLNEGPNSRATHTLNWNILEKEQEIAELAEDAELVFGFPPCTHLAASGAKHFATKEQLNPRFQVDALHLALSVPRIGAESGAPWCFENPKGVLSDLYRKPDHIIDPCWFGGYLPKDDQHPDFPKYIAPRDAYNKETHLWCGNGFRLPPIKSVVPEPGWNRQTTMLGGDSLRTKIIRSATPRGLFVGLARLYT